MSGSIWQDAAVVTVGTLGLSRALVPLLESFVRASHQKVRLRRASRDEEALRGLMQQVNQRGVALSRDELDQVLLTLDRNTLPASRLKWLGTEWGPVDPDADAAESE